MSAEITDIHEEQMKRETTPMTLKRLYRLVDNNIETLNNEARKQQELITQMINDLDSLGFTVEHITIPDTDS